MKTYQKMTNKLMSMSVAFALGFSLSACSSGIGDTELELNGKIFDAMGITSSGPKGEPKMAARAPLILPPDDKALPAPGKRGSVAEVWPDDPDARKKRMAALEKEKSKENCAGGNFKKSQDIDAIEKATDPLKDCKSGNFLHAIGIGRPDKPADEDTQ